MLSLTATELNRFMHCNGYKSLKGIAPFNESTEQIDEGVAAHWMCEQVFNGADVKELINVKAPNGVFITQEMADYCQEYLDFIKQGGDVETDTSYRSDKYEVRGRADFIKATDNELIIADLKYGWRIVEPKMNWTLISHAYGYLIKHPELQNKDIELRIYQPRPFHPEGTVRAYRMTYVDFLTNVLPLLRETLENPLNIVKTSQHCHNCACMSNCPAAQIAAMNALDISSNAFDSEIDNDRLSWMLSTLKTAQEVIKQSLTAYEDLAMHRIQDGNEVKGYNVQTALGVTTWNEDINPEFIKTFSGIDITTKKLITPAQAKKLGLKEDIIEQCTHRANNGFKLVRIDNNKLAEKMFGKKGK